MGKWCFKMALFIKVTTNSIKWMEKVFFFMNLIDQLMMDFGKMTSSMAMEFFITNILNKWKKSSIILIYKK
jgi:hypothetical protein